MFEFQTRHLRPSGVKNTVTSNSYRGEGKIEKYLIRPMSLLHRGPFLTSLPGPRGKISPLGGMFTPSFTPRGVHSLQFRRMEGRTENFTPGDKFSTGGQSLPIGVKLRLGLRMTR
jgi:hypothetical protein